MHIVKAEANQVEKIVEMSIRAFETDVNVGGVKGDCPPGFDSIEWHQQMAREGHLYQAMIENDLVGVAIVFPDETQKSVYIGRIFIDSVYHRKGYGIRLMECIEKNFPWAAEFHLDTPCWNERTNAFYKRLGYRIIKVEEGFVFYQKRKKGIGIYGGRYMLRYIKLRETPELKASAAEWFHRKWGVPQEAYLECMDDYLNGKTEYGWYLCLDDEQIVGGMGVIENDFHDRKDLSPNICAVYTEEAYRKQGIAGNLLNIAVEDLRSKGISPVYLVTDHTGFYERYGWELYCMVQGDGEPDMTRMYIHR